MKECDMFLAMIAAGLAGLGTLEILKNPLLKRKITEAVLEGIVIMNKAQKEVTKEGDET